MVAVKSSVNWGSMEGAPKWYGKGTPYTKLNFPFSEEEELELDRYCEKIKENISKDKMTPWERWNATIKGEEVDTINVHLHPETTYSIKVLDGYANAIKPIDSFRNPKLFLKAHLATAARFAPHNLQVYSYSYGEAEWGGKAKLLDLAHPVMVEPSVKTMDDVDRLVVPDPKKDGTYPGMLWAIKKMKELFKKNGLAGIVPILPSCCTPAEWIIPECVRGLKLGFLDAIKNPDMWHAMMKKTTEFEIRFAQALWEAGGDYVWCCQHHSAWPPDIFKERIAPYCAELAKRGPLDSWYYAANQETHVQIMADAGGYDPCKYLFFTTDTPVEFARQFTKSIDKAYVCCEPDKALLTDLPTLEATVKEHIKIGTSIPGVGFAMAAGAIDYWTPPQNVDAFVKYVKEYGKSPTKP
ncbi:MAG: uroporphyrinogen decarboxylase family protein [Candidatus Atabeyarchaeum deiterrae]